MYSRKLISAILHKSPAWGARFASPGLIGPVKVCILIPVWIRLQRPEYGGPGLLGAPTFILPLAALLLPPFP
jgi:hypothetical protein